MGGPDDGGDDGVRSQVLPLATPPARATALADWVDRTLARPLFGVGVPVALTMAWCAGFQPTATQWTLAFVLCAALPALRAWGRAPARVLGAGVAAGGGGYLALTLVYPAYPFFAPSEPWAMAIVLVPLAVAVGLVLRHARPLSKRLLGASSLAVVASLAFIWIQLELEAATLRACLPVSLRPQRHYHKESWQGIWYDSVGVRASEAQAEAYAACRRLPEDAEPPDSTGVGGQRESWWRRDPARTWGALEGEGPWTDAGGCLEEAGYVDGWLQAYRDCGWL